MWNPQDPSISKALEAEGYGDIRYLAQGGMSWIYLANDNGRAVCVKLLSVEELLENPSQSQELYQRFKQERDILLELDHPHIVRIAGQGRIGLHNCEVPFYAMEYCDGGSLHDRMEGRKKEMRGAFLQEEALTIFAKIARAVAYLHEKGYIHRDIKPQNILFAGDEPKLADLGLAKNPRQNITRRGDELGTPVYLAPEQRLGQEPDQRTDIYALGLILYEMLCGEIFHRQSGSFADKLSPLAKSNPKIAQLCYQMLAPRDMRLQSMREVVEMLGNLQTTPAPSWLWFWRETRRYKKRFQELESYVKKTRRGLEIIIEYIARQVKPEEICAEMEEKFSSVPPYLVSQELPGFLEKLTIHDLEMLAQSFARFNQRWMEEMTKNLTVQKDKRNSGFFLVLLFLSQPGNQRLWEIIRGNLQPVWPHRKLNALARLVHDPEEADAVEQLDFPLAIPALIWVLSGHGHWKVREIAARNLSVIGLAAREAVPALKQATVHEQWRLRKVSVEALGAMGEHAKEAVAELIQALQDSYPDVRESAARSLGMVGPEAHAAIPILLESIKDMRWEMRKAAILALGKLGAKQAVPELVRALRDENREVRLAATTALGCIGPSARMAVPRLKELIEQDGDLTRRKSAEWKLYEAAESALLEIGESAVPEYIQALKEQNWKVRWAMAYILGKLGAKQAVSGLADLLKDECWEVRENAARALATIGEGAQKAVDGLVLALKDGQWQVRAAAALALGELGGEAAVLELRHALRDDNLSVRHNAACALEKIEASAKQ